MHTQVFCKLRKCEIKNSSKSVRICLKLIFGSKCDSPLQINWENFIMGWNMVGFCVILDQRLALIQPCEVKNWNAHPLCLHEHSCDYMYHEQKSKSKWELTVNGCLSSLSVMFFSGPELNTCLNGVWNYCNKWFNTNHCQSELMPFKCCSGFRFFSGLLVSFL